ncbi:unnamed protein product [Adineta ricciae]|uniref:F-box domain-containing protein n=1 Tax=Adineta ricciae TaxID=249248 RepID=A0A814MDS1_ADIRI|nr:unnamed protein product [Adineta ricciae]CAF1077016.1 unnamed protein product [Adineta ricciae]
MTDEKNTPSIEFLPAEIFYRIFDYLDASTIFFSVRQTCRRCYDLANAYNRYNFDFSSISKSEFACLCRSIEPENVTSLTLADERRYPNQTEIFLSMVDIRRLIRLHTLNLFRIDQSYLNSILTQINMNSIVSCHIQISNEDSNLSYTTLQTLSSRLISLPNLRKLEHNRFMNFVCPINCSIHHLIINQSITLSKFYELLAAMSHLKTLVVNDILKMPMLITNAPVIFHRNLTSLTIDDIHLKVDLIESLLLLTPSLQYLKLIFSYELFNGQRWEEFIDVNLSQLTRFEFFCSVVHQGDVSKAVLEQTIAPFRSSFWTEKKKWYVNCESSTWSFVENKYILHQSVFNTSL